VRGVRSITRVLRHCHRANAARPQRRARHACAVPRCGERLAGASCGRRSRHRHLRAPRHSGRLTRVYCLSHASELRSCLAPGPPPSLAPPDTLAKCAAAEKASEPGKYRTAPLLSASARPRHAAARLALLSWLAPAWRASVSMSAVLPAPAVQADAPSEVCFVLRLHTATPHRAPADAVSVSHTVPAC
jgi:hypothetical protein